MVLTVLGMLHAGSECTLATWQCECLTSKPYGGTTDETIVRTWPKDKFSSELHDVSLFPDGGRVFEGARLSQHNTHYKIQSIYFQTPREDKRDETHPDRPQEITKEPPAEVTFPFYPGLRGSERLAVHPQGVIQFTSWVSIYWATEICRFCRRWRER